MRKKVNKKGEGLSVFVPYNVVLSQSIPKRIRLSKVKRRNAQRVYNVGTGEVIAKRCGGCGVVKLRADMAKSIRMKDGMASKCKACNLESVQEWRNIPENRKRKQKRDREYSSEWQRNNPDKVVKREARRNARKRYLPSGDDNEISVDICKLTGATVNVHLEHFIPLAWGHGGTILANCYTMEGSANQSKGNRNPFEWFAEFGERYGITSEAWNALIEELAYRNGLDVPDFVDYVYWCESNQRTPEELEADFERYGGVVTSLELWKNAKVLS